MADLTIPQAFDLAAEHHQAGRLAEAEQIYQQILAAQPDHAEALLSLGVVAAQTGRNDLAADYLRQAIACMPTWPDAHYNLGKVLQLQGHVDQAIAAFRQAIALNPNYAEAYNNLGSALKTSGRLDEAIAAYRQAIAISPSLAEAYNNVGNTLKSKGQLDEAIAAYRQAIAVRPAYANAYNNLGNALKEVWRLDEAIAACRQAIALKPNLAEAHNNLGNALQAKGQLDEAIAACRQAIALNPQFAAAYNNLGIALKGQGDMAGSIAAYRQAIAADPHFVKAHSNLVYGMHFCPGCDAAAIAAENRRWNQQHAEPLRQFIRPHANDRNPDRRLKIGYVSPDFTDHVIGRFLLPLLANHNHQDFEVFAYASVAVPDAMTQRLRGHIDVWRDFTGFTDAQAADLIRQDQIDILVDLTLHMAGNRLLVFARKPAPVQVTWLGYPSTTGLSTMDYRLADPYMDPPGLNDQFYCEQMIRLSDTFQCYVPLGPTVPVNPLPALSRGYVTFGCLNNFAKINDPLLEMWSRILNQVSNSRLRLLPNPGSHQQRTRDVLARWGIAPERVEFPTKPPTHTGYLELYHATDLGLDPYPYNGHTTSMDSFWMGVPVVTLVGQTAVARAGWSQLSNLGLPDLAGQTPEEYVHIAVNLANDLPRLAQLRATLRQRMEASPLMDAPRFAHSVESACRQMWRQYCAGAALPGAPSELSG